MAWQFWQQHRQQAEQRHIGADAVDEFDAFLIRIDAENRSPDAAETEGETEEHAGDEADAARHQFLREDDDGREGGGEHEADDDDENGGPEQVRIGQQQREGNDAEDREPDDDA